MFTTDWWVYGLEAEVTATMTMGLGPAGFMSTTTAHTGERQLWVLWVRGWAWTSLLGGREHLTIQKQPRRRQRKKVQHNILIKACEVVALKKAMAITIKRIAKLSFITHCDHQNYCSSHIVTIQECKKLDTDFRRCCTEDGYGYGAGGGEDDHHGYQGVAALMVCE